MSWTVSDAVVERDEIRIDALREAGSYDHASALPPSAALSAAPFTDTPAGASTFDQRIW